MKQDVYDHILCTLNKEAEKYASSPDEILNKLQAAYPNEDKSTLKQIRQQWYSRFLKTNAPAIYCFLDSIFPKYSDKSELQLVTAEHISEILAKFKSMPEAWLVKHILIKSKFVEFLSDASFGFKRRKVDNKEFYELSQDDILKYVTKQTFDFLNQLDTEIESLKRQEININAENEKEKENQKNQNNQESESEIINIKNSKSKFETVATKLAALNTIRKIIIKMLDVNTSDALFGPRGNALLHYEGQICEETIEKFLAQQNVSFISEQDQRLLGYDKTPDFLFHVPVIAHFAQRGHNQQSIGNQTSITNSQTDAMVSTGTSQTNISYTSISASTSTAATTVSGPSVTPPEPMLICWIESKCMFGDRETVVKHYNDQLEAYFQRYGPGLIIYFRGFVDEVDLTFSNNNLRMLDCLPACLQNHSGLI